MADLKRLAKRHKNIDRDFKKMLARLEKDPLWGTDLGMGVRKVRMAVKQRRLVKQGWERTHTHAALVADTGGKFCVLTIYDNAERHDLPVEELKRLIASVEG
jgi:hypothetical protein